MKVNNIMANYIAPAIYFREGGKEAIYSCNDLGYLKWALTSLTLPADYRKWINTRVFWLEKGHITF